MTQVNVKRLIDNIGTRTNVLTPIIEAVVNSIQAIEETGREDGKIVINIKRSLQEEMNFDGQESSLPRIASLEICDNGIGFTNKNRESFDTLYSDLKIKKGGKGFGRFTYLKYFENVLVKSSYQDTDQFFCRTFEFVSNGDDLIDGEQILLAEETNLGTIVFLNDIKAEHQDKLDKKIETIARKLFEHLLIYFINDKYKCPEVIIKDDYTCEEIALNGYLSRHNEIEEILSEDFTLEKGGNSETFTAKVFKIFFTKSQNLIRLTADNREVTVEPLSTYIPEFKDEFCEEIEGEKGTKVFKNYAIKVYVMGEYLNRNTSIERSAFEFSKDKELLLPFSQQEIEKEAAEKARKAFKVEVKIRQEKKKEKIINYVDSKAPWHKLYLKDLNFSLIPYNANDTELESELQKVKFGIEQAAKNNIENILNSTKKDSLDQVEKVVKEITEIGKSDLVHYVVSRKSVLDLFKKSLEAEKEKKYEIEKIVHDIIFPTTKDSENTPYEDHNLWIVDERLSFHQYLLSDKPLNDNDERPDILIFDNKISVRGNNVESSPIVVLEFKRPQRTNYRGSEDPIKQIGGYVKKIRDGKFKTPKGRDIYASKNTPAYGFLICDITNKIEEFCIDHSLVKSPDGKGYFGYQQGYDMYMEVISFDKLVEDAELRNKIFFKKLGLE